MNKSREKHYLSKSSIGTRQTLSLFRSSSKKKKEKIRAKISYRRRETPGRKEKNDRSNKIERDATLCKEATTTTTSERRVVVVRYIAT
tara:strand:+ start:2489 stop:2752 length:264 start_codon:yes stop_codon:yes gene_type:complete